MKNSQTQREHTDLPDFNGKVLVIWNGWREHALAWKLARSPKAKQVFVAPGNPGTMKENKVFNIDISAWEIEKILDYIEENEIGLTIVGPEKPLVEGIVDSFYQRRLHELWLRIYWPTKDAAQLEWSKQYMKEFCIEFNIPTAQYQSFNNTQQEVAKIYAIGLLEKNTHHKVVIKADGLAAGKWVVIAEDASQISQTLWEMFSGERFWNAWTKVVIEEFLVGEEVSMIYLIDKNWWILPMASSRDYKTRNNGNTWPNTWWMWAYSPADEILLWKRGKDSVMNQIIKPTVTWMKKRWIPFEGFLYAGLMMTGDGPKLLEYNVRFGDPETQAILTQLQWGFLDMCLHASHGKLWEYMDVNTQKSIWSTKATVNIVLAAEEYPSGGSIWVDIRLPSQLIEGIKIFHAGTKISEEWKLQTNGGRILWVTSHAMSFSDAQYRANQVVKYIMSLNPGVFFARTDIGSK